MISITLPDGSRRQFERPLSGADLAAAIGPGLAKAALAVKIDGTVKDLSASIEQDARVEIVTRTHPDALDLLRHDCAHVLAEAVQELYPGTQITFGPSIENGFYYDFARNEPFTTEDFPAIEAKMREIIARGAPFEREVRDRDDAIAFFEKRGEKYKAQLIQ
ncbi:MAG TPA: TGS domain-containing protein, partial [Dongiaceae bacterium]